MVYIIDTDGYVTKWQRHDRMLHQQEIDDIKSTSRNNRGLGWALLSQDEDLTKIRHIVIRSDVYMHSDFTGKLINICCDVL